MILNLKLFECIVTDSVKVGKTQFDNNKKNNTSEWLNSVHVRSTATFSPLV